ncbi:ankyrin repeat-containing protein At5g02620-like [Spinacia oleracea]|uniref:Ankyrin repeat-containing protein At5g02620-like n=1 Tax=Spinacia oleracea TaxID=3562 RepID=A0ABM3QK64_SPIOL|nr:ankyrin repeat-containing protein At5g02620-like [Spinacia oleracea]
MENNYGDTPLSFAIAHQYEKFALYILSLDESGVIKSQNNVLFLAIEKGCHKVAEKILEIVDDKGWNQLLTNHHHQNVLHLAPLCTKDFCSRLIERHPELLTRVDKGGASVLHNWIIKNGEVWLFEYILNSKLKSTFVKLIGDADYNDRNNPFHIAATTNHEATNQVVKILVEAYKEDKPSWVVNAIGMLPWFAKNKAYEGPLQLAIRNQNEELALDLLRLHKDVNDISKLLDYYEPPHTTLFLAVQNNCSEVAEYIMSRLDRKSWTKYLKDSSDGRNIMHLVPSLTDEKFGTWLVKEVPELITQQDANRQSAWEKAHEIGHAWFIKAILEKDPSVFDRAPLVWTKACENGHVLALCAFINHNPEEFRDLCIEYKDSPLHHIKLKKFTGYEKFLKITPMKEFINLQDSKGATPLHKAIRNKDLLLTETLLTMDKIMYNILDDANVSAIDLLAEECDNNQTWDRMCKRIGLDPRIKTTYFKDKTNLLDVRNSLFIVAALLATITFTAGFTLPGGFNQEIGAALLGNKPAFLVFLVSDALALFFSMLVLIFLTWSMVFDASKSLVLIDRSMVLLRLSFNFTLVAFMTGVYVVIAPMSLWAAILIIVIMSSVIGISINKNILYDFPEYICKFIPTPKKKQTDQIRDVEMGTPNEQDHLLGRHGEDSNEGFRTASHT